MQGPACLALAVPDDAPMTPNDTVSPPWTALAQGAALGFGLIVAIGAQNAFVLRQGLRREHVGPVVLLCALADAALITAGVLGMAQALGDRPTLAHGLALAGAAFLALYGWQALQRARHAHALTASPEGTGLSRRAALAQAAAFTLLNPHVYLDTVVLLLNEPRLRERFFKSDRSGLRHNRDFVALFRDDFDFN